MGKDFHKEFTRLTGGKTEKVSLVTEKTDGRGKHPNSRENLEPFEKGVSGNPDGRPMKYVKLKNALQRVGKEVKYSDWGNWGEYKPENSKDSILYRIWYEAESGSIAHIRMLAELGCLDDD